MGASQSQHLPYSPNCTCTATQLSYYDPDIAGLGVLLGFALSGFLALTLSTLIMILRHAGGRTGQRIRSRIRKNITYNHGRNQTASSSTGISTKEAGTLHPGPESRDTQHPYPVQLPAESPKQNIPLPPPSTYQTQAQPQVLPPRKLRRALLTKFAHLTPQTMHRCNRWAAGLERIVLGLSDQQLLASFIILAISIWGHAEESTPGATLGFACDLVFYSSVTHAATLIALRSYLQRHPRMTIIRITLLYLTFIGWAGINCLWLLFDVPWKQWRDFSSLARFSVVSQMVELVLVVIVYLDISIPVLYDEILEFQAYLKKKVFDFSFMKARDMDEWQQQQQQQQQTQNNHRSLPVSSSLPSSTSTTRTNTDSNPKPNPKPTTPLKWWFYIHLHHHQPNPNPGRNYFLPNHPLYTHDRNQNHAHNKTKRIRSHPTRDLPILWVLFGFGTANLYYDLYRKPVKTTWGFGQLLPLGLTLLPFITLLETYSDIHHSAAQEEDDLDNDEEEEYYINNNPGLRPPRPSIDIEMRSEFDTATPSSSERHLDQA